MATPNHLPTDDQDRAFNDLAAEHLSAYCVTLDDGRYLCRFDHGAREVVLDLDGGVVSDTVPANGSDLLREGAWS